MDWTALPRLRMTRTSGFARRSRAGPCRPGVCVTPFTSFARWPNPRDRVRWKRRATSHSVWNFPPFEVRICLGFGILNFGGYETGGVVRAMAQSPWPILSQRNPRTKRAPHARPSAYPRSGTRPPRRAVNSASSATAAHDSGRRVRTTKPSPGGCTPHAIHVVRAMAPSPWPRPFGTAGRDSPLHLEFSPF